MTADDLEELVLGHGGSSTVVEAFAAMDERERKKLSPPAKQMHALLTSNKGGEKASPRLKAFLEGRNVEPWKLGNTQEARKATLVLFAVCPVSALTKRSVIAWYDAHEVRKILADRKPGWLDEWVAYHLDQQWFGPLDFPTLRWWIRSGLCRKPEHDRYYDLLALHLMRTMDVDGKERHPAPTISEQLLADPDLLEDVWGLFRVETVAFNTNSWFSKGAESTYETWPEAMAKLSRAGKLDRGRLLDASLEGLTQDVKQNQLAGIARFHRDLDPTREEMEARQAAYHLLLSHRVGYVVKLGLDMTGKLHQQGALETDGFFREIQSVYLQPAKGNAVAALKLTGRVLKKTPGLLGKALPSIREALRNDSAEVQALALDLVEAHSTGLTADQVEEFGSLADFIKPAVRARFNAVLKVAPEADDDQAEEGTVEPFLADGTGAELREGKPYAPLTGSLADKLILPTVERLIPIETLDELIAAVSHAVEQVDSPDEVERIIDGVSRLCDQRPADFEARIDPLRHRLGKGGSPSLRGLTHGWTEAPLAVADLVMSWLTGQVHRTATNEYVKSATDAFAPMVELLRWTGQRAANRNSRQLLSAPTHQHGWIDPEIWIARLIDAEKKKLQAEPVDFCYSLLRLTPDRRAEALARCAELSGYERRVATFALGGDERPLPDDRRHHALWITAARAREPAADWSDLFERLDLEDDSPDGIRPAAYSWRAFIEVQKAPNNYEWKQQRFVLERGVAAKTTSEDERPGLLRSIGAALTGRINVNWKDLPTAALNHTSRSNERWVYDYTSLWASQWLAHLWPQNPAAAFATAAAKLALRMDQDSSSMEPGAGYLNCLFQKNRPWGELGHLALLLGVAGKDADARGLSIDALIEGIENGQFDPEMFGASMAKFGESGWMKPGRIADTMQQASRISPLHAWTVGEALEAALPKLDLKAANMFAVVELLLECKLTVRQPIDAAAATSALTEVKGEGKMAKAARQLLELKAGDDSILRQVRRLAQKGRAAALIQRERAVSLSG